MAKSGKEITVKNGEPCPFCGSKDALGVDEDAIECKVCGAIGYISPDEMYLTWIRTGMKYWIRTTHDFDNETREWKFRESLKSIIDDCMVESQSVCSVHAVPRDYWATLWQIAESNRTYYEQWKDDPFSCGIDPIALSEDVLLKDLELMEQFGLVKSKVIL